MGVRREMDDVIPDRLAELVASLTGCTPDQAAHTVSGLSDESPTPEDALALVAKAVVAVTDPADRFTRRAWTRPAPRPEPMRLAGYVRSESGRVIDLRDESYPPPSDDFRVARYLERHTDPRNLPDHGSLRRWERSPVQVTVAEH
jgi:hypothetical protein